jgi:hypothetical protein
MYDPIDRRFMAVDPVRGVAAMPQTLNPYLYVVNNPLKNTDPTGEFLQALVGAGIGALIGGAVSLYSQMTSDDKIDWAAVGADALTGAVAGALIGSGVGLMAGAVATPMLTASVPVISTTVKVGVAMGIGTGIGMRTLTNTVNVSENPSERMNAALDPVRVISDGAFGAASAGTGAAFSSTLHPSVMFSQYVMQSVQAT